MIIFLGLLVSAVLVMALVTMAAYWVMRAAAEFDREERREGARAGRAPHLRLARSVS